MVAPLTIGDGLNKADGWSKAGSTKICSVNFSRTSFKISFKLSFSLEILTSLLSISLSGVAVFTLVQKCRPPGPS